MPVTVQAVTQAKTGKSLRVLIGQIWYGAALESGITKGMIIEPLIEDTEWGPWIKKWKSAEGKTLAAPSIEPVDELNPPPEESQPPPRERAASANLVAPYFMPFVSNICAHAIAAGHIREPGQLGAWAKAAAETAIALETL